MSRDTRWQPKANNSNAMAPTRLEQFMYLPSRIEFELELFATIDVT